MIVNTNTGVINSPRIAWNNIVTLASSIVSTPSTAGFPVEGLLNGYTTDQYIPASLPAVVEFTYSTSRNVSMVCFAGHTMFTGGVTVSFQQFIGGAWTAIAGGTPPDNEPFILSFPQVSGTQFRVRFTGASTFRLAVLFIGGGLTIPGVVVPPHTPLHRLGEVELIGGAESGTGEFLQADSMRTGGRATLTFSAQERGFVTGTAFEAFRNHFNAGKPFFIACTPTFEPNDVGYCWRNGGNMVASYSDPVYFALSMDVGVYIV